MADRRWSSVLMRLLEAAGIVLYVYVVGGAVIALELSRSGLPSGPQLIAQLPQGQLVAVGVRSLAVWAVVVVAITAPPLVLAYYGERRGHFAPADTPEPGPRAVWMALTALALAVGVLMAALDGLSGMSPLSGPHPLLTMVWYLVFAAVAGLVIEPSLLRRMHPRRQRATLATFALAITGLLSLSSAADHPAALSRVVIRLNSRCIAGPLLSESGQGVLLAEGRTHDVVLIPNSEVLGVRIERRSAEVDKAAARVVPCPTTLGD